MKLFDSPGLGRSQVSPTGLRDRRESVVRWRLWTRDGGSQYDWTR